MRKLLKKELTLCLHPAAVMMLFLSALVLAPNYPYAVSFFYLTLGLFFICLEGRENHDVIYTLTLPVAKRDAVTARFALTVLLELVLLALVFGFIQLRRRILPDPNAAGMFFNLKLETGETQMIRAVLEGICFHLRWMLECQDKKIQTSPVIRFVGGGALSPVTCQILADVTGRPVETVPNTKDVGAIGAAMLIAVGKGIFSDLGEAAALIRPERRFEPNGDNRAVYEKNYRVFRRLYESNKKNFALLNGTEQ
jgi:hypothetical protein